MADLGTAPDPLRDRIIDAALALAEADAGGGGYDLRLHLVAQRLDRAAGSGAGALPRRRCHRRSVVRPALRAMVQEPADPSLEALPPSGRVRVVPVRWFDAQAAHRRAVGSMIRTKLHPSHPHHWARRFSPPHKVHRERIGAQLGTGVLTPIVP